MTGGWFSPRGLEGWGGVCGADSAPPSGSSFGNKHGVEVITTSSLDRRGQGTTASAEGWHDQYVHSTEASQVVHGGRRREREQNLGASGGSEEAMKRQYDF